MRTRISIAAMSFLAAACLAVPAGAANAAPAVTENRVIHVDEAAPFPLLGVNTPLPSSSARAAASDEVQMQSITFEAEEPEFVPPVGETWTVHFSDATAEYTTLASGCTQTASIAKPSKSNNRASAAATFRRSAGCSGNMSSTALLYAKNWAGLWSERARSGYTMWPGEGRSINLSTPCSGTGSTTWKGTAFFGSSAAGLSESGDSSLSCGI